MNKIEMTENKNDELKDLIINFLLIKDLIKEEKDFLKSVFNIVKEIEERNYKIEKFTLYYNEFQFNLEGTKKVNFVIPEIVEKSKYEGSIHVYKKAKDIDCIEIANEAIDNLINEKDNNQKRKTGQ
ncbi:MAG: hypothetical protein ACRCUM_02605 [Mycoplasmoidaceae bacterium]